MWNLSFSPPDIVEARILTRLPDAFRQAQTTGWSQANKPGQMIDSFLEGPSFDTHGNLWVTDIPNGRIFRIDPDLNWELVVQYDGWPNGSAFHADGRLWIADYRQGILCLDPDTGTIEPILSHRNSEAFKGVNDLTFDAAGVCYFTDQGQTGLQDPSGRVYKLSPDGRLEILLSNVPSPNGLVLSSRQDALYVAATRANALWRVPVTPDGAINKVGMFRTFFGASGPDGLAADVEGGIVVGHASLKGAFRLNVLGEITHYVRSPVGATVTNLAFRPNSSKLVIVESQTGTLLEAELPVDGRALYSHSTHE